MSEEARSLRKALVAAGVLGVLHVLLVFVLDAMGLVESLLSPSGLRVLAVLPLAGLFYVVRLALLFVMPGLVAAAVVLWAAARAREGRARRE